MKHKIEVFSAGCKVCIDTIDTVKKLAGSEHEVVVHEMQQKEVADRAAQHGVRSVPAVLINGKLAGCCAGRGARLLSGGRWDGFEGPRRAVARI